MTEAPTSMGDGDLTVRNILLHGARCHGDRWVTTVQAERTSSSVAFADVAERAGRLASALRSLGIGSGDRVGSLLPNSQPHLDAYFGVPAMGAVLHTINVRLSATQIAFTVEHADDRVIIVDPDYLDVLLPALPQLSRVRALILTGPISDAAADGLGTAFDGTVHQYDELLAAHFDNGFPDPIDERSAATLCYTTGTTGDPKGVSYSHRSIWLHAMSLCTANAIGLSWRDTGYIVVPMFHANAWGYPYALFWAGGDLVLSNRFVDPDTLLWAVRRFQPTFANGVPAVWNDVLRRVGDDVSDLGALASIVVGGAPVPASLRRAYSERFGVDLIQGWGMTETSPLVTVNRPPRGDGEDDARYTSQGRLLAGVELRVVDMDSGGELPWDGTSIGELQLRGPWVASSYFGIDAQERFADGWLRTGDVGTVDALGYVRLTDRDKDVIKSGGEWISSVELENHLAAHDEIVEATVIGVPDERWDERPCAVVVLAAGSRATPADLRGFLDGRVPRWWIPERWALIDEVPRTSVGKFDKKRLRQRYADGALALHAAD